MKTKLAPLASPKTGNREIARLLPRLLPTIVFLVASVTAIACVTVNVNFPEVAVQKATDDYVKELYRAKEKGKNPTPATENTAGKQTNLIERLNRELGSALVSEAWAGPAEGNFVVNTPKAREILESQKARVQSLLAQKRNGFIGETKDGRVTVRGADQLKPLQKKNVEGLVQDENADREKLYAEIIQANGLTDNALPKVQKSFARSFQAESPSGTWVESADGQWSRKP